MSLERRIYNIVKKYPAIKNVVKYFYQYFFAVFSKKNNEVGDDFVVREGYFFGFHDKSPWSKDNRYIIAHGYNGVGNEQICKIKKVDIVLFYGSEWNENKKITSTAAWNWQQGSQLQWVSDDQIIFNDFLNDRPISRIVDIQGNDVSSIPYHIGAISAEKRLFASFSFRKFGSAMKGYGYNFPTLEMEGDDEKLSLIIGDIDNPLNIKEIDCLNLKGSVLDSEKKGDLFISHALFSPSGNRIAFMKRLHQKGRRVLSEIYVHDINSDITKRLPCKDMVSHYTFVDDDRIFVYANTDNGDGYYMINVVDLSIIDVSDITNDRDGHPSASSEGSIVFDTYPDRTRHQDLYLWGGDTKPATKISRLYAPLKFKDDARVDLHPRIRSDGKYVCFDTSCTGKRALATMKI